MIKTILSLAETLKNRGHFDYAEKVLILAKKISPITKCVAVFKYPIQVSEKSRISYFEYKVNSPEQMMAAIPQILSKKHSQVWFLGKNYQLPAQARILASRLLEEKRLGNITCECYIEDKK